jgi:hypothetical protein
MDPIAMQKQLRDNSEDLTKYIGDLNNWQDEIKQKEQNLKSGGKETKVCHMCLFLECFYDENNDLEIDSSRAE